MTTPDASERKEERQTEQKQGTEDTLESLRREVEALRAAGEERAEQLRRERAAFARFREETARREAEAEKKRLARALLREAGIDERRLDAVLRVAGLDEMTVRDGRVQNREEMLERIRAEWGDFIPMTRTVGAAVEQPPAGGGAWTREGILAIRDTGERQAAIAAHLALFGR